MSWLDQLLPASFRGVPFQVDDIRHDAGDTVVVREYPFQDLPTVFRMGEGAEEIRLSAYVVGDDYIEQREALRQVLTGEGVLVHPTAGSIRVYVAGRYSLRENPTFEGGVARFDLVFIRAESRRYPAGVENTEAAAADAADAAAEAGQDAFAAEWSLADPPAWVVERATASLQDALGAVWDAIGPAVGLLGQADEWASSMIGAWQELQGGFAQLVGAPAALAGQLAALFTLPAVLTQPQALAFQGAYARLFDVSSAVVRTDFETVVMPDGGGVLAMFGTGNAAVLGVDAGARVRLAQLTAAGDQLVETLATAGYVRALARVEMTNYDEGMAARAALHAQCTRLLLASSDASAPRALPGSSWHDAMMALHTAGLRDLQARTQDLVRLTTYTPGAWMPVWYISHLLYGTADYADEILQLNDHIEHPLLVPPGRALRVRRI
ncbi:MAG: DNA circularization protein [Gammaproteobacteria bacterium]